MNHLTINDLPRLKRRDPSGHKGNYGRVLIVGGSPGMVGAAALAANAAFRAGAGLVQMALPEAVQQSTAVLAPCATSHILPTGSEAIRVLSNAIDQCDYLAVGPGMGVGARQRLLLQLALESSKPLVIDADGLNNLAQISDWPGLARGPVVLTPHPGEFSRLTGWSIKDIQSDRESLAAKAVSQWRNGASDAAVTLLLKGAGTIVTDGESMYVNDTGNPGMAAGGAGDVLTGVIAGLLGQDLDPFQAACLGAWAHGLAGDIAASEFGELSMMASDLLDFLPEAFSQAVEEEGGGDA